MNFDDFYGMREQVNRLRGDAQSGRWVHAYLFSGPEGTGKNAMATICARAVNCVGAQKPCDHCPPCKLYLNGSHPDHIVIEPERSIGVEAIRALNARLGRRPFEGEQYTVVIRQADKMTTQAQNALLKTLEAPPGGVVFFLLTQTPSALLATILSRVRTIRFSYLNERDAQKALEHDGIAPDRAALLARVSRGSVGMALELNENEAYWQVRDRTIKALNALTDKASVGRAAMLLKDDHQSAAQVLDIIEDMALTLLRAQSGRQADNGAPALDPRRFDARRLLIGLGAMRRTINSNVRWQSALEMLFFDIVGG